MYNISDSPETELIKDRSGTRTDILVLTHEYCVEKLNRHKIWRFITGDLFKHCLFKKFFRSTHSTHL